MEQNTEKKHTRGGARNGAGRKRTTVKQYMVYATQDIHDILETVEGSKSDYICRAIKFYHEHQE